MAETKQSSLLPVPVVRDTVILQCLAALLIANSHLEGLYPRSWMAADGLIGDTLFFFLSGYGLAKSEQANHRPFLIYYLRRVLRIYPSLWLVAAIFQLGICEAWRTWHFSDYVANFLYPTAYGYIRQIMIFYVWFFCLLKFKNTNILIWTCAGLVIPYLWLYVYFLPPAGLVHLQLGTTNIWLWDIFYFQMMLVGAICGSRPPKAVVRPVAALINLLLLFAGYVALKFAMVVSGAHIPGTAVPLGDFYIILLVLTFFIVLSMFRFFTCLPVRTWLASIPWLHWIVALIGGLTLEIYLVHTYIAYNPVMRKIHFPLNIMVWLPVTVMVSWGVLQLAQFIRKALERMEVKK